MTSLLYRFIKLLKEIAVYRRVHRDNRATKHYTELVLYVFECKYDAPEWLVHKLNVQISNFKVGNICEKTNRVKDQPRARCRCSLLYSTVTKSAPLAMNVRISVGIRPAYSAPRPENKITVRLQVLIWYICHTAYILLVQELYRYHHYLSLLIVFEWEVYSTIMESEIILQILCEKLQYKRKKETTNWA